MSCLLHVPCIPAGIGAPSSSWGRSQLGHICLGRGSLQREARIPAGIEYQDKGKGAEPEHAPLELVERSMQLAAEVWIARRREA
jgi:hypothetical protein